MKSYVRTLHTLSTKSLQGQQFQRSLMVIYKLINLLTTEDAIRFEDTFCFSKRWFWGRWVHGNSHDMPCMWQWPG